MSSNGKVILFLKYECFVVIRDDFAVPNILNIR